MILVDFDVDWSICSDEQVPGVQKFLAGYELLLSIFEAN